MNRAELIRAEMACKALAQACRAKLDTMVREGAIVDGYVSAMKLPGVEVIPVCSTDRVTVTDMGALIAYLRRVAPTEIETVTPAPYDQVRPVFLKKFLTGLAAGGDPVMDPEGNQVPGVVFVQGGVYQHLAFRPTDAETSRLSQIAADVADGNIRFALPGRDA